MSLIHECFSVNEGLGEIALNKEMEKATASVSKYFYNLKVFRFFAMTFRSTT